MKAKFSSIATLLVLSAVAAAEGRAVRFAGKTWDVKAGVHGPGNNHWSDGDQSVRVDDQGRLHLKIRRIDGVWNCAEVSTQESFGYGTYTFEVASDVEAYDPNVVVGLFTYLDDAHEIDVEFSRWGNAADPDTSQYVIQPGIRPEDIKRFRPGLDGDVSTHRFLWREGFVRFQSYRGFGVAGGRLVQDWASKSPDIPKAGGEKLHINLWLNKGCPPTDSKEAELIVKGVTVQRSLGPAPPRGGTESTRPLGSSTGSSERVAGAVKLRSGRGPR
jgi:hypothetical protein